MGCVHPLCGLSQIIRIDSYQPRVTPWDTYAEDLQCLCDQIANPSTIWDSGDMNRGVI